MNKIDLLKEKIENGGDFLASMEAMREQAQSLAFDPTIPSDFERGIYQQIYNILTTHQYSTYVPTGKLNIHLYIVIMNHLIVNKLNYSLLIVLQAASY